MRKLVFASFLAGLFALLLTGCKGKDKAVAADPKSVITAFFEKMSKKDIDGATKLCTKESKTTMDLMKKGIEAAEKMKDAGAKTEEEDEFKNMQIGEAKIDGDNATVSVTNTKKKETVDFPLKKEDGEWKVDFTMSTLMKMGMDAKKDGGDDLFKTDESVDTTGMEEMKDLMNSDTLKNELNKLKDELKEVIKDKE